MTQIKELAKENIELFNNVNEIKNFISVFLRTLKTRVNEHQALIKAATSNISHLESLREQTFTNIEHSKSINDDILKSLVKENLTLELKIKENEKNISKQFKALTELFVLFEKTELFSTTAQSLLEQIKNDKASNIKEINNVQKKVGILCESIVTKTNAFFNKLIIELNDIAVLASKSVKLDESNFAWWNKSLEIKRAQFNLCRDTILNTHKLISMSSDDVARDRNRIMSTINA